MDNGDKCLDENEISLIMTLPEETMRNIFNYLSFETLYFSLRRVCKNVQTYVDRYLDVRGTSFLIGCQEGSEKEVIEIIKKPKEGSISLRVPVSCIAGDTSNCQNNKIVRAHRDGQIDMIFYANMYETSICKVYKSKKGLVFRYDLESEKWKKLLEKCGTVKCLDPKETSQDFIQGLLSDISPYHFEIHSYGRDHYPFKVSIKSKAKHKIWSVGKIMSCKRLRL